ncbi:MAG: tryptophan--tRNA ligase [Victivallaceae bacterium]
MNKKRVLTGDRPTGKLHVGHWVGSIKDRLKFQADPQYSCFFLIADLHVLTTKTSKDQTIQIKEHIKEVLLDWLCLGIDPEQSVVYLQSTVPQIYELQLILSMLTSLNRVYGIPSLKEMARNATIDESSMSCGLIGYPILQAADILLTKANIVPVGKDNVPHIEFARDIAKKFNGLYGDVFPEPFTVTDNGSTLVGTDGAGKMSKSANNTIYISDDAASVRHKVKMMYTDPNRIHATTPGNVENNPVFMYHDEFNPNKDEVASFKARYREGKIGDAEIKNRLAEVINDFLEPFRERRQFFANQPDRLTQILKKGSEQVEPIAAQTLRDVRDAMGLNFF